MSSGPGHLQQRIIEILAAEGGARMAWTTLKGRFPQQLRDRSFHRAIRSLEKAGRIDVRRGEGNPGRPETVGLAETGDLGETVRLSRDVLGMVAAIARARGVSVPAPGERVPDLPPWAPLGRRTGR